MCVRRAAYAGHRAKGTSLLRGPGEFVQVRQPVLKDLRILGALCAKRDMCEQKVSVFSKGSGLKGPRG